MITIIDYNSGNTASIKNALKKLGAKCEITSNPAKIKKADKIIFPGQGAAGNAMENLKTNNLIETIKNFKKPFLGICLGLQILFEFSEEDKTKTLGIFKGNVHRFPEGVKIPQIGWNKVKHLKNSLFSEIPQNSYFYFVNSYYVKTMENISIAQTEYEITFCSAAQKNNFYGVQFHPEKSGEIGQKLLSNFINLC